LNKKDDKILKYEILNWDSDFFGMKVSRIAEPSLKADELADILSELKHKRVKLVYWPANRRCEDDDVKRLCGHFVDEKTTFAIDFGTLSFDNFISTDIVESYTQLMPISDIEGLAIESGKYSRFAVDTNLPREKFVDLYKIWINRSLSKEIASEVLVIREEYRVVGMVTLGDKNGRGEIDLIAVNRNCRRKKYGEKLVRAAQRWFVANGFEFGEVVTQGANIPAIKLFKKCGYSIENIKYFYHFWL
jgi:ribosomal protein S18 acetylase RimI-like enzyme